MSKIFVVVPTYNERGNLKPLVEEIFGLKINGLSVLVVDDNSPDDTGQLADELSQKYPLQVLHRAEKQGLGKAYVEAFKDILSVENPPDYIIQMDADFSHDPKIIPKMLEEIKDHDLVLGSRYVPGGKIENWDLARRLISRFGNFYARLILGLPYRDLTGGFKCFRHEVLENINLDSLSSVGYCFQIETTLRAHRRGYKIRETPITFVERKTGVSKFNPSIISEAFWQVFLMRWRR